MNMGCFAMTYEDLLYTILQHPVNIKCRGRQMAYELTDVHMPIQMATGEVSIYSHRLTRTFPIKFALAEFAWMLAMRDDVESIAKFNKNIVNYSDDKVIMGGAYGKRLDLQIYHAIKRLRLDEHTRQACASIWKSSDSNSKSKDHPCNIFLQFMIRNGYINLTVTSRSSDIMTGLLIDAFHWQFLLCIVRNDLLATYPDLKVGEIVYNIASLHAYETDNQTIQDIIHEPFDGPDDGSMYHTLHIPDSMTYDNLVIRCSEHFGVCETLIDLTSMFEFPESEDRKIMRIHDDFINRKHKLTRTGDQS